MTWVKQFVKTIHVFVYVWQKVNIGKKEGKNPNLNISRERKKRKRNKLSISMSQNASVYVLIFGIFLTFFAVHIIWLNHPQKAHCTPVMVSFICTSWYKIMISKPRPIISWDLTLQHKKLTSRNVMGEGCIENNDSRKHMIICIILQPQLLIW